MWGRVASETDGVFVAFALGGEKNQVVRDLYEQAIPPERLRLVDYCSRVVAGVVVGESLIVVTVPPPRTVFVVTVRVSGRGGTTRGGRTTGGSVGVGEGGGDTTGGRGVGNGSGGGVLLPKYWAIILLSSTLAIV